MNATAETKPTQSPGGKAGEGMAQPLRSHVVVVPMENDCGCSRKALQYAIPFARTLNARIVLLNILPVRYMPTYHYDRASTEWVRDKSPRDEIVQRLARLAGEAPVEDIPVEIRIEYGPPSTLILNVAKMLEADLIVMSTHSPKGLLFVLLGSVASRVARLASCPVLVVREKEHEFDLKGLNRMA